MTQNKIFIAFILLLTALRVCAQADFAQEVQRKLSAYHENVSGPKAYITFNQPEYFPDDTAFFKTYLLTASGNALMKGWQVIDLFVTDENNSVVLRNRTSIKNGIGASQFAIPRNAREGRYTVIVAQPDLNKAGSNPVAFSCPLRISGKKLTKPSDEGMFAVHGEGGSIVAGVSNTLVVTGLTPGDTAFMESSGLQTLKVGINNYGVGKFSFTPQRGQRYFLRNKNKRIAVEPATEKRVAMTIAAQKETNSLEVMMRSSEPSVGLHLVCISKNKVVEVLPVVFGSDGHARLALSMSLLPAGVSRLSVLDDKGHVYADRFFFRQVNSFQTTDSKETYSTRSPIEIEFTFPKELSSRTVTGAVSVYKKDLFPLNHENSLVQMVTFADVNIDLHLSTTMPEDVVNDLMVAATAKADWQKIWADFPTAQTPAFSPFFKGRVVLPNGVVAKDSCLITFWFKDQDFIYNIYASAEGKFSFPLFSEFNDDEILYTVSHKKSQLPEAKLVIDSTSMPSLMGKRSVYSEKENPYAWFSALRTEVERSYGYFKRSDNDVIVRPYVESIPTDAQFPIEKFKDFASVAELINEVVPVARAKKVGDRYELRVFLREFAMHASANPLVVIDGVVTDSIDYLMNMNPGQIKSLGVVNSRNKLVRYGELGRNGLVTIETTRTEIQSLRSQKSIFVKGIDQPVDFTIPSTKPMHDRSPSLRSALYWDPRVTLTKTSPYVVQLQTSDDVGEYVVIFSGLDEKGMAVEITKYFTVKFSQ